MINKDSYGGQALVVQVRNRVCAVPLLRVREIMRPLPIEPVAGTLACVSGLSVIRGLPTPVIDLAVLLGMPATTGNSFVSLRLDDRQVAFSVSKVLGICELRTLAVEDLPPLLQGASRDVIDAIGTLDSQVLAVLRSGWELPQAVWQALSQESAS